MYIIYIRERHYFSPMWTFQKAIKNVEVKVDVQKGALSLRRKTDNRCTSSHFHPSFSYDNSPQWLFGSFLLGFAIGSRFYKLKAHELLMGSLEICFMDCG